MRDARPLAAGRIAAKTGCRLICETFPSRLERGGNLPAVEKLPYFPEQALELMGKLARSSSPALLRRSPFSAIPTSPVVMIPEGCATAILAAPDEDAAAALEALADALGAPRRRRARAAPPSALRCRPASSTPPPSAPPSPP